MASGIITIRITPEKKKVIRALAGQRDMSMSEYIFSVLEKDITEAQERFSVASDVSNVSQTGKKVIQK